MIFFRLPMSFDIISTITSSSPKIEETDKFVFILLLFSGIIKVIRLGKPFKYWHSYDSMDSICYCYGQIYIISKMYLSDIFSTGLIL